MKEKFPVQSTHSKDPILGIHVDILTNFRLSGKNLQLESLGKKYSDLIKELAPKIMSSSFLKNRFELTQTTKSISGRKYIKVYIILGAFPEWYIPI